MNDRTDLATIEGQMRWSKVEYRGKSFYFVNPDGTLDGPRQDIRFVTPEDPNASTPYAFAQVHDGRVVGAFTDKQVLVVPNKVTPEVAMELVLAELKAAQAGHGPMNSAHEGYAVLLEEVHELWDIVKLKQKNRDLDEMRKEAVQVAAMAIRFLTDVCNEEMIRK